jgi:hypothetical protein
MYCLTFILMAMGAMALVLPPLPWQQQSDDDPPPVLELPPRLHAPAAPSSLQRDLQEGFLRIAPQRSRRPLQDRRAVKLVHAVNTKYKPLVRAFNKKQLRHADQFDDDEKEKLNYKANQWLISGIHHQSYMQVGKTAPRGEHENALGQTHRALEMTAASATIHAEADRHAFKANISDRADAIRSMHILLNHDATSCRVQFGRLQAKVAPHARYFVQDANAHNGWRMITLADWKTNKKKNALPMNGVLELFASRAQVHWVEDGPTTSIQRDELLFSIPCFLEDAKASTIAAALRKVLPDVAPERIVELASEINHVFVSEVPDGAASNVRKKAWTAEFFSDTPNIYYSPLRPCAAHRLNRIITSSTNEKRIVGDIHAVHYSCSLQPQRASLRGSLRKRLEENLIWEKDVLPDPAWVVHTRSVLSHTIGRARDHVRARLDDDGDGDDGVSSSFFRAAGDDIVARKIENVARNVTGDIRKGDIYHHEKMCGQCSTREDAVAVVESSLLDAGLLLGDTGNIPAHHRWGTCTESASRQAGGIMICNILPAAIALAFADYNAAVDDGDLADDESGNLRRFRRNKVYRSRVRMADCSHGVALVCLSWVSEAVDHLLRRIQYDDASGASLKDVLHPKTNPFMHAQSKLSDMATLPLESGPLRCVAHHYADADAETRQLVQDTCFNMSVSLTVQIGHYFDELTGFPFKLAKSVDPRFSE